MLTTRRFRVLVAVTAISGYLQIALGGLVRVSGSGLGCPDWPTCYGRLYPPLNFHSIVEYSHRTNGAIFGLLVILVVVAAFWMGRRGATPVRWLGAATLAMVVGEGLLGWQVVANLLAPVLVLVHLAIALLILALMIAVFILAAPPSAVLPGPAFGRLALVAAGLTYLVLLTGSAVVATNADLVCKAWPLCGNGFAFDFSGVAAYDMLHRLLSAVVGLLLLHVLSTALRRHRAVPGVTAIAAGTLVLLAVQGALGAAVAVTDEVALYQGAHVVVATAVWAGIAALAVISLRSPRSSAGTEIGDDSRVTALGHRPA